MLALDIRKKFIDKIIIFISQDAEGSVFVLLLAPQIVDSSCFQKVYRQQEYLEFFQQVRFGRFKFVETFFQVLVLSLQFLVPSLRISQFSLHLPPFCFQILFTEFGSLTSCLVSYHLALQSGNIRSKSRNFLFRLGNFEFIIV